MNPYVSVVLPVYNAECYLRECINSILNQSYSNFELIIINDGSTDSSLSICKEYEILDSRIILYNQENHGVSFSRNIGIENSKGEYICFVDSDDVLNRESLENRVKGIGENDLYIGKYEIIDSAGNKKGEMPFDGKVYEWIGEDCLKYLFAHSGFGYQGYLWNKLFRNSIIKKNILSFDENISYNEDCLFVLQYLIKSNLKVGIEQNVCYKYRVHDTSAMAAARLIKNRDLNKLLTEITAFEMMEKLLMENSYPNACIHCSLCLWEVARGWYISISKNDIVPKRRMRQIVFDRCKYILSNKSTEMTFSNKFIVLLRTVNMMWKRETKELPE